MSSPLSRDPLIDIFKALACAVISWHHLAFYGPMSDAVLPLFPRLLSWLYDYGRMAVQVFLVLGGYLLVVYLAPQGRARFGSARQQIVRRFTRLVVPYAVALVVAVLAAALVRPWLDHPSVPAEPRLPQLLAHALLLQNIVDEESLSAGVWYVAIDFQLFVLATLLFAGVRSVGCFGDKWEALVGKAMVVAGIAASLLVFESGNAPTAFVTSGMSSELDPFCQSLFFATSRPAASMIVSTGDASAPPTPKLASVGPTPRAR